MRQNLLDMRPSSEYMDPKPKNMSQMQNKMKPKYDRSKATDNMRVMLPT